MKKLRRKEYRIKDNQTVINSDSFDRRRFGNLLSKSPNMEELALQGKENYPSFVPLMSDIYSSLYKVKPEIKQETPEHLQPNKQFMDKIMNLDGFEDFRDKTKRDDLMSALGTMRYGEKVEQWIDEQAEQNEKLQKALEEAKKQQEEMQKQQQKMEQQQEKADNAKSEKGKQNAQQKADKAQQAMEQAQQSMNQAMQQAQQEMADGMSGKAFKKMMEKAQEESKEDKRELSNLMGAGSGSGDLEKLPIKEKLALADILRKNKKVKKIAEWAGKFKAIARQKRKVKHEESVERSGVTLGDDVERLLPQELAQFSNPATKIDFLRRYTEKQTMVYSPVGKEEVGKGPIVICFDQSGSMRHLDEQTKGFVLVMAMIAKKERRDLALIPFADIIKPATLYPKGKISGKQITELAATFLNGGTKFKKPLKEALQVIKKNKRFKKSDILFVTDGDPHDLEAVTTFSKQVLNKEKEKHEISIMSILIGDGATERGVKSFSDTIVRAKDFQDDEVMEKAFKI